MSQGGVLQVRVDLLDDRMVAVRLVREHAVAPGALMVKNAWKRHVWNRMGCPAGFRVQVRDAAHDQAPGHPLGDPLSRRRR